MDTAAYHKLALAVAPELAAAPLYVVGADEIGPLPPNDCLGFATFAPEHLADRLPWRGPGPVIALDFAFIAHHKVDPVTVLLHEVAHALPAKALPDLGHLAADSCLLRYQRAQMEGFLVNPSDPTPGSADDCHDWRFCRRALHLFVRAASLGHEAPPMRQLFSMWWQSWAVHYLPTVLSESLAMRSLTFAEIEATEPPAAFMKMWQSDIEFYHSCQNQQVKSDHR